MIAECLKAAGIRRVVWIDDQFRPRDPEGVRNDIIAEACTLARSATGQRLRGASFTGGFIVLADDPELIRAQLEGALPDNLDELVEIRDRIRRKLRPQGKSFDFLQTEFSHVADLLREGELEVETLSYARWTELRSEIELGSHETLMLVDRDFTDEQIEEKGEAIIASVLKGKPDVFCILLSQDFTSSDAEEQRNSIVRTYGIPKHAFALVSKRPEEGQETKDLAQRLARYFRTSLLYHVTHTVAARVASCAERAGIEVATDLGSISVYEIDTVLFENSLKEGVSEVEVILRLVQARQRTFVHKVMSDGELRDELARMRRVRRSSPRSLPDGPDDSIHAFRQLRNDEVFSAGTAFNHCRLPLANGDVFEVGSEVDHSKYILLGQPCDLVVRNVNGRRGMRVSEEGVWIKIEESLGPFREKNYLHRIDGLFVDGREWWLNLRKCFSVNLTVLDLCVLNDNGQARLVLAEASMAMLHEDWELRQEMIRSEMASVFDQKERPPILGGSSMARQIVPTLEGGVLSYAIRRIGRIEARTAAVALGAWASYNARAALDHDFARRGSGD